MATGDKVLVLLLAKIACCVGLTLAATGALGGLGIWLLEGAGRWAVGAALVGLIAAIVFGWPLRAAMGASSERRGRGAQKHLEQKP